MIFMPKYNMTREQNIFVAKRNIVYYIYKSAQLEGLGVISIPVELIPQFTRCCSLGSTKQVSRKR